MYHLVMRMPVRHLCISLGATLVLLCSLASAQEPIAPPDDFDAPPPPPSTPEPRPVPVDQYPYEYERVPAARRYDGYPPPADAGGSELLSPNARRPYSVFDSEPRTRAIPRRGDVLDFPAGPAQRAPQRALPQRSLPRRSMTMAEVAAQYGEPLLRHPTVGDPPITRWDYPDFSVFFEHRLVLHSVIPENPPEIYNEDQLLPGY